MIQNKLLKGRLELKNLQIVYNKNLCALKGVSFTVNPGEFVCIIGPSGCGKTTILYTIAGFINPTKGQILLDGNIIASPSSDKGFIFQKYLLFPWKTVIENVEFGLKMKGLSKNRRRRLAKKFIDIVGLKGFENYFPNQLSAGMEQRVSISRVLVNDPAIVLMDEPFASLDALTRVKMQELLLGIYKKTKKTIIFVTHDIDEALILSDRILIMSKRPGKIKKEIKNNLPKPRTYKLTTEMGYIKQKKEIMNLLK